MIDAKFVGRTYGPVKYEIGLEKIKEYAQAVGETSDFYLNEEAAKDGPYQTIVAPPMFAVVYQKEIVGQALFDSELDLNLPMLVHGEQEFQFHRLLKPREEVYTTGEIVSIVNKEKLDVVTLKTLSTVDDEPVTTGYYTFGGRR